LKVYTLPETAVKADSEPFESVTALEEKPVTFVLNVTVTGIVELLVGLEVVDVKLTVGWVVVNVRVNVFETRLLFPALS
jgi:hypothetical protein